MIVNFSIAEHYRNNNFRYYRDMSDYAEDKVRDLAEYFNEPYEKWFRYELGCRVAEALNNLRYADLDDEPCRDYKNILYYYTSKITLEEFIKIVDEKIIKYSGTQTILQNGEIFDDRTDVQYVRIP